MAEAKKTTKKVTNKADEEAVEAAESTVTEATTEKIEELVEAEAVTEAIVEAEQEIEAEEASESGKTTAKAGKRSAKSIKEAEEKQAKEERKAHITDEEQEATPKVAQKPARSRLERRSKAYRKAVGGIDKTAAAPLGTALEQAAKASTVKFDAAVEMHVRLNVDPRQADQNIRATVILPAGTGKTVRVAVFGDDDQVKEAKKAGAEVAGADEFLQQLDKEVINFDVLVSTPQLMPKLGKYARLLGPKGLMPNPKSGTVTTNISKAVSEAKAGKVEYRVDSTGIIHLAVGKVSFGKEKLQQNATAVLESIKQAKPSSIKGAYIKSVYVTTSMGPSVQVETSDV